MNPALTEQPIRLQRWFGALTSDRMRKHEPHQWFLLKSQKESEMLRLVKWQTGCMKSICFTMTQSRFCIGFIPVMCAAGENMFCCHIFGLFLPTCKSFWGFQSESKMMQVSAAVRLIPSPPALVHSRNTKRSESGLQKRSMAACRRFPRTRPSMRSYV